MTYTFIPEVLDYVAPADTLAQASEKINTNFQAIADGGLFEGTAGEALAQYTVVCANSSDSYKLWLADANGTVDEADAIAITLDAISDDATGTVQFGSGVVTNVAWAWTPKSALFLGLDGAMTHDPSSYSWTKPLGMAISATEVWFAPSLGWSNSLDEYEIASDRLEMGYIPTNYTRTTTPEVTATTQLSAHLKGIDLVFSDISETPVANKIPVADGSAKLDGWITTPVLSTARGAASGVASLNASTKVVEDPANATSTKTASKIPIADSNGYLNTWVQTGNTTGTICAGDDSRLSDNRTPTSHTLEGHTATVTVGKVLTGGVTENTFAWADPAPTWGQVSSKPSTFAPVVGTGATDACAGNDARLSDTRTPKPHALIDGTGHTASGLTAGHVVTATGATAYAFQDLGLAVAGYTAKTAPVDTDYIPLMDSETTPTANLVKKLSWAYVKSVLKTYFDGVYTLANLGGVATSVTVNGHPLTSNVAVLASDVNLGNVVNVAQAVKSLAFTEATSSPALLLDPPDACVITKVVIVVSNVGSATAASTVSVGVSGTTGRDMAVTDSSLVALGTYIVEPYTACGTGGENISLTVTRNASETFGGTVYLHYAVPV